MICFKNKLKYKLNNKKKFNKNCANYKANGYCKKDECVYYTISGCPKNCKDFVKLTKNNKK